MTVSPRWLTMLFTVVTTPRLPRLVGLMAVTSTSLWMVSPTNVGFQDLLVDLEQGEARHLLHRLAQQPLHQAIGQGGGHKAALDATLVLEGLIDEDHLQHAGRVDETDEIGLGDGAVERAEPKTHFELVPGVAVANGLHELSSGVRTQRGT